MPEIDPELWVLVHGGPDPDAVAEWPFRAQWAWFMALVDWVAYYADEEGWAIHSENNWDRVAKLQEQGWPPNYKVLRRAARVIEMYLDSEEWSCVDAFRYTAQQWERCFSRGRKNVGSMGHLWKAFHEARAEPVEADGFFMEKLVARMVRYDVLGGNDA